MQIVVDERQVSVGGLATRYLTGGEGPPLVLLHGTGESARSWRWVLPELARTRRVYAPSLPGFGATAKPAADYSPGFFTDFVAGFLDTLGLWEVTVVGNSLGGLVAMRLALATPARVTALGLVDSAGLGPEVTLALRSLTVPGIGELAIRWYRTRIGAGQWALGTAALLFASPRRVRRRWLAEKYRQARQPGYLEATVATLRGQLNLERQREILVDELPRLTMPTLVVWGARDRVVPARQARSAVTRLPRGQLALIPDCGHVPQVEHPGRFVFALGRFRTEPVPPPRT